MIVADIHQRLSDLDVPVLTPEQIQVPGLHKPAGGNFFGRPQGSPEVRPASGLTAYLVEHPSFIQLNDPRPIPGGVTGEWWTVVTVVSSSQSGCLALSDQVQLTLAGTWEAPGDYELRLPGLPRVTSPGVYVCAQTYASVLLRNQ